MAVFLIVGSLVVEAFLATSDLLSAFAPKVDDFLEMAPLLTAGAFADPMDELLSYLAELLVSARFMPLLEAGATPDYSNCMTTPSS